MSDQDAIASQVSQASFSTSKKPFFGVAVKPALLVQMIGIGSLLLFAVVVIRNFGGSNLADLSAVFVASTLSSVAGFAFSAICGAMLFHLLTRPVHIVQIMLVCSIAIQLLSVVTLRNAIDWKHLARFIGGGIIGLPLGIYLLTHLASHLYLRCIGIFLIAYGLFMIVRRPPKTTFTNVIGDYIAGFLGGVTGEFVAFPGAFVTIWCGLKGWTKDQQRGVYQPFILIMQVLALALISFVPSAHEPAGGIPLSTLFYVPGALLGTWCGIAIFRRLTDVQFARVVNLLLIVSGLGLLS